MFLPLVFCVLFLQSVFGSPMPEADDESEWMARYGKDFEIFDSDHWYKWWYGGKRKSSVQERIQILETRQKVLFDLVLCESHNRLRTFVTDECELFRKKAEQVFGVPSKDDAKSKNPTTAAPQTTAIVPQETTAAPQGTTTAPPVTTAVPQEVTTVASTPAVSTVAPVITTAVPQATTPSTAVPTDATPAAA